MLSMIKREIFLLFMEGIYGHKNNHLEIISAIKISHVHEDRK